MKKFVIPYDGFGFSINNKDFWDIPLSYALAISTRVYEEYVENIKFEPDQIKSIITTIFLRKNHDYCLSDEYMKYVEETRQFVLEEISFKILDDSVTPYEKNLVSFIRNNTFGDSGKTPLNNGLLASFPHYVFQAKEREKYNNIISEIRKTSEYVGELKKRDTFSLEVISKRYIRDKAFWVVNAIENGKNLVIYFDDNTNDITVGKKYIVRATPVKHDFSAFNKCKETRISRVVVEKPA